MPEFKLNGRTYSGSMNYASAVSCVDKDGNQSTVQNEIEMLNEENNTLKNFVEDLNGRLAYIEENLGTLTTEEYTCSGTFSLEADWPCTLQRHVTFDRIFVEPPTIGGYYTHNHDGKFTNIYGTDVTTTSATVNVDFTAMYDCTATVVWTAMGLVRKQNT